jgi:glycosyltransferase involved in cell wall biosynthesis
MMADKRKTPLLILIPVYNDWESVSLLLQELDSVMAKEQIEGEVLMIDDGSIKASQLIMTGGKAISRVDILHLRRNLGHQRALAIGLAFIHSNRPFDAVVIMDGDGEDRPSDVPRLFEKFAQEKGQKIIFAARVRRSEGRVFSIFYHLYRLVHRMLTGISVRVGNFSILSSLAVSQLVIVSELWNHYAAAVFKAKMPYSTLSTSRGKRLAGQSSMNFVALFTHGLSALSVFGDIIGARLLIGAITLALLFGGGAILLLATRLMADVALPVWVLYIGGLLLVLLFQAISISFLLVWLLLNTRASTTFVPLRDYNYFVRSVTKVYPQHEGQRQRSSSRSGIPAISFNQ